MRKIYRAAITVQEANQLIKDHGNSVKRLIQHTRDPIVDRLVEQLSQDFEFTVKEQSYFRVEKMPKGHQWHTDTGDIGQMKWCELGCSVLLTDTFTGGKTRYATDETLQHTEVSDRRLCDLAAHTSDVWHMVEPHQGNRIVLLIFI